MAQTVKIISDSTCDLSKDLLEKYDIETTFLNVLIVSVYIHSTTALFHSEANPCLNHLFFVE